MLRGFEVIPYKIQTAHVVQTVPDYVGLFFFCLAAAAAVVFVWEAGFSGESAVEAHLVHLLVLHKFLPLYYPS